MCSQCENCSHSKFCKGSVRGIMDADPDEYWCSANEDEYYYSDDDDIKREMYYEFIEESMKKGMTQEEAEAAADEEEFEVECPSYSYFDAYEYEESMRDGPYDTVKEAEGLA